MKSTHFIEVCGFKYSIIGDTTANMNVMSIDMLPSALKNTTDNPNLYTVAIFKIKYK